MERWSNRTLRPRFGCRGVTRCLCATRRRRYRTHRQDSKAAPAHCKAMKLLLRLLILCFSLSSAKAADAQKPNILIILVDDMGYGDPRCFNPDSKIVTPHIDKLAAEGMRFTDAHAGASICVPSRYSLLTGRMPYRSWVSHGAKKQMRNGHETLHFAPPMLHKEPTRLNLATLMKRQGYATACVGKWHQGMSTKAEADGTLKMTPLDFGFDYYFGFDAPEQGPYAWIENKRFVVAPTETIEDHPGEGVTNIETQGAHWRQGLAAPGWKFEGYLSTIASKADGWLEKQTKNNAPFFLYYAIPAPHAPWATSSEFKGKSGAGQYGDFVMEVDAKIGQVMATLDKLKLKDDTLVFFSSDNGPVWYVQDIEKFGHRAAGPWDGMKGALTEAGHHMPFIASWPGKIQAGSSCGELICFADMLATVASLLGEKLPSDAGEDSFDFTRLLRGETPAQPIRNGMVHVNYGSYTLAIREGDWKLILPSRVYAVQDGGITPDHIVETTGKGSTDKFQLYNLRTDPGEATNLFAQEPDKAKELFAALKADIVRGRSR
ncbi:MAG: arylsulfatase [Pirellula sp.]|nr:arylsulfatase [Pirellula sp.]